MRVFHPSSPRGHNTPAGTLDQVQTWYMQPRDAMQLHLSDGEGEIVHVMLLRATTPTVVDQHDIDALQDAWRTGGLVHVLVIARFRLTNIAVRVDGRRQPVAG